MNNIYLARYSAAFTFTRSRFCLSVRCPSPPNNSGKRELERSRERSQKITTSNHVNLVYLLSAPFGSFRSFRTLSALYSLLLQFSAFFCLLVGLTLFGYPWVGSQLLKTQPMGRVSIGTTKSQVPIAQPIPLQAAIFLSASCFLFFFFHPPHFGFTPLTAGSVPSCGRCQFITLLHFLDPVQK